MQHERSIQPALFASENIMITVYGQPKCHPCRLARQQLDKELVPYSYVDLSKHPEKARQFQEQGLLETPIIETPTERFTGLQPDRITHAAAEVRQIQAEQQRQAQQTWDTSIQKPEVK